MAHRSNHVSNKGIRGRKNRKSGGQGENNDKYFQELYRNNKGAFPSNMTERDILQALKTNRATQENLTNVVSRMFEGDIQREQVWKAVQTKKNKDKKKQTNSTNGKYGRSNPSTTGSRGGSERNRHGGNRNNKSQGNGINKSSSHSKPAGNRNSKTVPLVAPESGRSTLTDFVKRDKSNSAARLPSKDLGKLESVPVPKSTLPLKVSQPPPIGSVWSGVASNRVLLKHKEAEKPKEPFERGNSAHGNGRKSTSKSKQLNATSSNSTKELPAKKHTGRKKACGSDGKVSLNAPLLNKKVIVQTARITGSNPQTKKVTSPIALDNKKEESDGTMRTTKHAKKSKVLAVVDRKSKCTDPVCPKLGILSMNGDDGGDDMMFGDFGDEEDLVGSLESSTQITSVEDIEVEALASVSAKQSKRNPHAQQTMTLSTQNDTTRQTRQHRRVGQNVLGQDAAAENGNDSAPGFDSTRADHSANNSNQHDRRQKAVRGANGYDKNGARRSNVSRKSGRVQHMRNVPNSNIYHPQMQYAGFPQQLQFMDPAIAMMGYQQQMLPPPMQMGSGSGGKGRKAAGPPPGMPDTQKSATSVNTSSTPQPATHQNISVQNPVISQTGYAASQSQPAYPPGMGAYGTAPQNYYANPYYGYPQYSGQPYGAQYSQRGAYAHPPPGIPYQPYPAYDPNSQPQGHGTAPQTAVQQNGMQQSGYMQQQVYQQTQYPQQNSAIPQNSVSQHSTANTIPETSSAHGNTSYSTYNQTNVSTSRAPPQAWN